MKRTTCVRRDGASMTNWILQHPVEGWVEVGRWAEMQLQPSAAKEAAKPSGIGTASPIHLASFALDGMSGGHG